MNGEELTWFHDDYDCIANVYFADYKSILLLLLVYGDVEHQIDCYSSGMIYSLTLKANNGKECNLLNLFLDNEDQYCSYYHLTLYFLYSEMYKEYKVDKNMALGWFLTTSFDVRQFNPYSYRLFRILSFNKCKTVLHYNCSVYCLPVAAQEYFTEYQYVYNYDRYKYWENPDCILHKEWSDILTRHYERNVSCIIADSEKLEKYDAIVVELYDNSDDENTYIDLLNTTLQNEYTKLLVFVLGKDFRKSSSNLKKVLSLYVNKVIIEEDSSFIVIKKGTSNTKIQVSYKHQSYVVPNMNHNSTFAFLPKNGDEVYLSNFIEPVESDISLLNLQSGYIADEDDFKSSYLESVFQRLKTSAEIDSQLSCYPTPCMLFKIKNNVITGVLCDKEESYVLANRDVYCFKPKEGVNLSYLYKYLLHYDYTPYVKAVGIDSVLDNISDITVSLPDYDDQCKAIDDFKDGLNVSSNQGLSIQLVCVGYNEDALLVKKLRSYGFSKIKLLDAVKKCEGHQSFEECLEELQSLVAPVFILFEYGEIDGMTRLSNLLYFISQSNGVEWPLYICANVDKHIIEKALDTIHQLFPFKSTVPSNHIFNDSSFNQLMDCIKSKLSDIDLPSSKFFVKYPLTFKAAEWLDHNVPNNRRGEKYEFSVISSILEISKEQVKLQDVRNILHRIITLLITREMVPNIDEGGVVKFLVEGYIKKSEEDFYVLCKPVVPFVIVQFMQLLVSVTNKEVHGVISSHGTKDVLFQCLNSCLEWVYSTFIDSAIVLGEKYFARLSDIEIDKNDGKLKNYSLDGYSYWYCGNIHITSADKNYSLREGDNVDIDMNKVEPERRPRILILDGEEKRYIVYHYKIPKK